MSNARKLQTEIDRVMKKVDEGVELFDEIWEKVYSAEQQNQKEKYEMDLKKEIKKLQRLRDQIKTWIGSSDVKDKEPLVEARRLIETKMEQFKICEKETKTKTYSKEGLAREEKLDPAEEAKLNTTNWLGEYIDRFKTLVEETDFEIERLSSGRGKKTNKHQIENLNEHIANHRYHISKMEGIIRLVNNDRLDVEPVDQLKDDLDYYLDSWEDEDYQQAYDEEYFYESLGLEDLDVVNVDRVTQAAQMSTLKKVSDDAASSSSKGSKDKKNKKSSVSSVIPLTIGRARSKGASVSDKKGGSIAAAASAAAADDDTHATATSSASSTGGGPPSTVSAPAPSKPTPKKAAATPAPAKSAASAPTSMAAILKRESEQQEKERQKLLREQQARQAEQLRQQQAAAAAQKLQQQQQQEAALRQQQQQEEALRQQQQQAQQEALQRQQQQEAALRQQQQEAAAAKQAAALQAQQAAAAEKAQQLQQQQAAQQTTTQAAVTATGNSNALDVLTSGLGGLNLSSTAAAVGGEQASAATRSTTNDAVLANAPPAAAAAAEASSSFVSALNESFATTPSTVDNDRARQYTPQNPYPTPAAYPGTPSSIFDNPAVFEKLGTDCLFFIFYYAQGTYQQYLAARELKKQSWRFHKKYMTWFQRHEEPKITTDEYEQGTYVYFDYETGWCTRIKTDFRFEYSFLEDSLQ